MAKRFTDTGKWGKSWFRKLSPPHKCLWFFLLDNCDSAGVIDLDFGLASFQIGDAINESDLLCFGDRVEKIKDDTFLICDFVSFQYGELKENYNPHKSALCSIEKNQLKIIDNKVMAAPALRQGCRNLLDKDKAQYQYQDQAKTQAQNQNQNQNQAKPDLNLNLYLLSEKAEIDCNSEIAAEHDCTDAHEALKNTPKIDLNTELIPRQGFGSGIDLKRNKRSKKNSSEIESELDRIYLLYPRKEGKTAGMKKLKLSKDDLQDFEQAVKKYAEHCRYEKKSRDYTKMFSTFCTDWRDWVDYEQEKSADDKILEVLERAKRENAAAGIHDVEVNYENGIDWLADDYNWEESCMK